MPLGKLRSVPELPQTAPPAAGPSRIVCLPSTSRPQQWDESGHELDLEAMEVDGPNGTPAGRISTDMELLDYAKSLTLSHSLASTRHRHMTALLPRVFTHPKASRIRSRPNAAVEYFPSTTFHTVNQELSKGKGKQKAVNQGPPPQVTLKDGPPAHELSCVGWCGMEVGPVEYEGVTIWIGQFVRDRQQEVVNYDAQRRERERKERERKERERKEHERRAQAQAAAARQQTNAAYSKPADIPLTLIQKVNQAASQNPWLATLIHKAAKHEASKDELTQLGKVVSTLQAQLSAAGPTAPKPFAAAPKPVSAVSASPNAVKPPAAPAVVQTTASTSTAPPGAMSKAAPVTQNNAATQPAVSVGPSAPRQPSVKAEPASSATSVPFRPAPPTPRETSSLPFIVISFRDNPSDKFLLPLGTNSFISRVPPGTGQIRQSLRRSQHATSFPTLHAEDIEDENVDIMWEKEPAPGTVLVSYMVPTNGWGAPKWPEKPRPVTTLGSQDMKSPAVSSAVVKPTSPTFTASTPSVVPASQSQSLAPAAVPSATGDHPEAKLANPSPAAFPVLGPPGTAAVLLQPGAQAFTGASTAAASATPPPVAVTASTPTVTAASAPAQKTDVPKPLPSAAQAPPVASVYPPLIRLATTSLLPEKGHLQPVTIRLTGVTDAAWRAMQNVMRVVDYDELGELALDDPPPQPPVAVAPTVAPPVTDVNSGTSAEKPTRAAEEERKKEEERRMLNLREEYEAKIAARNEKIVKRHEKKASVFRQLLARVPARKFLKHRLEKVMPELVEAETDKFAPRLYNIYPRSRFGLPPPAYRDSTEDTSQLELDLELQTATASTPNPRKRKSEPAVAFEVPMSFDGIDEAVEEQARKAYLKGQGSKRRKSEGGEDSKRKTGRRSIAGSICEGCGSSKQRVWRKGPGGKSTLCKHCGDKFMAGTLGPLVAPGAAKPVPAAQDAVNSQTPTLSNASASERPPPALPLPTVTQSSGALSPAALPAVVAGPAASSFTATPNVAPAAIPKVSPVVVSMDGHTTSSAVTPTPVTTMTESANRDPTIVPNNPPVPSTISTPAVPLAQAPTLANTEVAPSSDVPPQSLVASESSSKP